MSNAAIHGALAVLLTGMSAAASPVWGAQDEQEGSGEPASQESVESSEGSEPGENEPGASEPGVREPGVSIPGVSVPGVSEPGVREPGESIAGERIPGESEVGEDAADDDAPELSASIEERADLHLELCDLDDNGWISLREAEATLGATLEESRAFDRDRDGRIDRDEFARRFERALELLGAVSPPTKTSPGPTPATPVPTLELTIPPAAQETFPAPSDLLAAYDADGSAGLNVDEVAESLRRANALLSAEVIVEQTDIDESGELDASELGPLATMLSQRDPWRAPGSERHTLTSTEETPAPPSAASIVDADETEGPGPILVELLPPTRPERTRPPSPDFGAGELSTGAESGTTSGRPYGHFARLDADGDGRVGPRDLESLVAPVRSSVRGSAVIAALDRDGDGHLDPEELDAALQGD